MQNHTILLTQFRPRCNADNQLFYNIVSFVNYQAQNAMHRLKRFQQNESYELKESERKLWIENFIVSLVST